MDHRVTPGTSGVPLFSENTPYRVAVVTAILEIHTLTKEALPKEISREIRGFRGTPSQLEQKAVTFGQNYAAGIDEILDSVGKVFERTHPSFKAKLDQAHQTFDDAFDEEIQKMADRIHAAPTFEKAQTMALSHLEGPFRDNIETAFQQLANSLENLLI